MSDAFMAAIEGGNDGLDLTSIMAQEEAATAAAGTKASEKKTRKAKDPAAKAPKGPKPPKAPEGPNPWGIHNDRGEIITTSYLRKYLQCSTRGDTYSLNRAANMQYFMSDEYMSTVAGKSAGEVGRIVANNDRWFDETHPRPVKTPRASRKVTPAAPATAGDPVVAASEEEAILNQDASVE